MQNHTTAIRRGLAALSIALAGASAFAADYPDHTIKMIVGFPAGQSSDASARRIAQSMTETLRQTVFVDNKPGAAGIISHEAAKNAAPDGYTLLMSSSGPLAINPSLYRKLPYDPVRDFEPVALVSGSPLVVFANPASPVNSVKELIEYVKARPGKLTYGSGGSGTTSHIAMEMLKTEAGIDLLHVPYKGSPAMITDVIGGQIDFAMEPIGSVTGFAKSGKLKLLGIATLKRYDAVPDLSTIAEQGVPGFQAIPWTAIVAPKGTPAPIVERLNAAVNKALQDPAVLEQTTAAGSYAIGGSAADAAKFLQEERTRWGQAVKASGAQVD